MKTKKIFSLVLVIAMLACMFIIPTNAVEIKTDENVEIIIENKNLSEKSQKRIIDFYTNGSEGQENSSTYGLTCTLLGHNFDYTRVYKITHEVRATAPRCLKKTYEHAMCTRCDYEESTLVSSAYIACC